VAERTFIDNVRVSWSRLAAILVGLALVAVTVWLACRQ
jgi:hypothetical protein